LFLAIPFAVVAGIRRPGWNRMLVALSLIQALNLAFFYGVSEGLSIGALPRTWTIIDTTVWLAVANCVAFFYHARLLDREVGTMSAVPTTPGSATAWVSP
jgi:uncharacterized membrane protein